MTTWEPCRDEELAEGIAALATIVGKREAAKPSWLRRLVRATDGERAWGVVVNHCIPIPPVVPEWKHPWVHPNGLAAIPTAYPLAEGVALLGSEDNPEIELNRRIDLHKAFLDEKRRFEEEQRAQAAAEEARQRQAIADGQAYREKAWQADYTDLGRFALGLAVLVEKRGDAALADDLRVLAGHCKTEGPPHYQAIPFPLVEWWKRPAADAGRWWERANNPSGPAAQPSEAPCQKQ